MRRNTLKPGWTIVKFGDVVKNANLTEYDPISAGIERIVGLEHIDPENLHIRRWNNPEDGTSFSRKFVSGQTLFGKRRAYQRKVVFAEFEGICSGDILTFESKNPKVLLPELLPFICQTDAFFDHALGTSAGSLSPRTSWKALKEFKFPLPPLEEQQRIAEILWAVDEAVEKWQRVVRKLQLSMGVILTHLKDLPEVNRIKLGNLVENGEIDIINGPFGTLLKASAYTPNGIPLVNPTYIRDGLLDTENSPCLGEKDVKRLSRYSTKINDILIGRKGDMDRILFINPEYEGVMTGTDCLRIRILSNSLDPKFLYYWLRSPYIFRWLTRFAHGTTMPGINEKTLHHLDIPLLDSKHQKRVVRQMEQMERLLHTVKCHHGTTANFQRMLLENSLYPNAN